MSFYPAIVTSLSPLQVTVQGGQTPVPATVASWSAYVPAVDDLVLCDQRVDNGNLLVLGRA